MPNYDFRAQVNPMQGVSMQDLVASKQSPITTMAQAGPTILEALRRRSEMKRREAAMGAMAQVLGNGDMSNIDPNVLSEGFRAGLISVPDLLDIRNKAENSRTDRALKEQKTRELKTRLDEGYVPTEYDQFGNPIKWAKFNKLPGVSPDSPAVPLIRGGNRPPSEGKTNPIDEEIAAKMRERRMKQGTVQPANIPTGQPGTLSGAPPAPPRKEGFDLKWSPSEKSYYYINKKNSKIAIKVK